MSRSPSSDSVGQAVSFGDRLAAVFAEHGQLCVGIDPHSWLLGEWGLSDDANGLLSFGLAVVDATIGRAGIVKPQVAFFERHGSAGIAALEQVIAAARTAGLLVIADAKRGDVGTSVEAYGEAWLSPGSPLESDAMTISAFQGVGSIAHPLALAAKNGKGLFVLAATSNPEAAATQSAIIRTGPRAGLSVAAGIVADVAEANLTTWPSTGPSGGRMGHAGVVLGATVDFQDYGLDLATLAAAPAPATSATPATAATPATPATPVLAPGFGHQGARFTDFRALYGPAAPFTILSASRSILGAGPTKIAAAIEAHSREVGAWVA